MLKWALYSIGRDREVLIVAVQVFFWDTVYIFYNVIKINPHHLII